MISDLDPTTLGPFYDNINLYYLLTALSAFYVTKTNTFMFGDKPIDVLAILDPFRVKSPTLLKNDTHLIIYECCAALTNITPKFAKILSQTYVPQYGYQDEYEYAYKLELTDFLMRHGSDYSPALPYQLYPVDELYYTIYTDNERKTLKTTAHCKSEQKSVNFGRDVFMLFTFDKTPENLYNMIVEAFIKEAPTFLTVLTGRINSTKIAVLQKIGKNGPIREALTRNDSKLRSFDLVDSRFKNLFDRNNNGGKKRSSKKSTNSRCGNSKARYYRRSVRVKHRKNTTRKR